MIPSKDAKPIYKKVKFNALVITFFALIFIGAVFYHYVEGLSYGDSVYFSVITLTTVGYGDISPQTGPGKAFTVLYILIGIGIIMAFIDTLSEAMVERRTQRKIKRIENNGKNDE